MIKTEGYENSELFMALTPKNGFKASKLYSYKPIDGTGDFQWSRNHTAYRLNQEGVLELMGNNVPRVDYTNTCPELLIEKASTNLVLRSQEFDNATWIKANTTITTNSILAPDNTLTADLFVGQAGLSTKFIIQLLTKTANIPYTISVFVKSNGYNYFRLEDGSDSSGTWFDLSNGTIVSGSNSTITPYNNGWYKVTFSRTTNTTDIAPVFSFSNTTSLTYNADGVSGGYIWGAQVEQSDYATSYIFTTTTTQTRPQDICYNTANGFGDTAWSVVMRVRLNNIGSNTSEPLLALNDGTTDNYFCIYTDSNPKLYFDWYNNPDQETLSTTDLTNGIYNIGVSYDDATGDYIVVIDGGLEFAGNVGVSLAGAFTGTLVRMDLGSIAGTGSPDGDGIIGVQYYNSALSQTDLENLTTA